METGPYLRVSSDRLDEPKIELGTPGYKASGLSTTPWRLLFWSLEIIRVLQFV